MIWQLRVNLLHPPVGDHVLAGGPGAEVHHCVVPLHHGVQDADQVEQGLGHGDTLWLEPFSWKYHLLVVEPTMTYGPRNLQNHFSTWQAKPNRNPILFFLNYLGPGWSDFQTDFCIETVGSRRSI